MLIAPFPSSGSFPCEVVRSASTLLFSRPAQRLLTLQPVHSPNRLTILSIEGFRRLVALPPAPIATGWSDPCREGFAPSQELCLSTAHDFITTTLAFRFSVHTGIFAICCDLTRPIITRLARTFQSTRTRRCREQYMPLVALCQRHFLADSIIYMCVFDFRQAQRGHVARRRTHPGISDNSTESRSVQRTSGRHARFYRKTWARVVQ